MKYVLPILVILLTVVFIAAGNIRSAGPQPTTPVGAVQAMFADVKSRNWDDAFEKYLANSANMQKADFIADLAGRDGSLRSYSALEEVAPSVLSQNSNQALVRVNLQYSSAVGALEDTRDLKVVREGGVWKVVWPVVKQVKLPPQVIPVTFLRWDVVYRGAQDDWGAQDVAPPKVRITSMNAIDHEGSVIILGEIVNDDTVPGFVSVNAALIGKNNDDVLGEETAFDKISHVLLPKAVSPFRIDFPGVRLAQVKSVRMTPNSLLVPASADPVVGIIHQRLAVDERGHHELAGELLDEGGLTVNIPQVLATFYDNAGKVVWVSDGYVSRALLPGVPEPFAVRVADDLAAKVQTYRVSVNTFSWSR
jgi:hypothetical protein